MIKLSKALLLALLVVGQAGCATSDEDLNYSRNTIDNSGDNSYHGWNSVPKEKSQ